MNNPNANHNAANNNEQQQQQDGNIMVNNSLSLSASVNSVSKMVPALNTEKLRFENVPHELSPPGKLSLFFFGF